jgi:cytochrome c oxidase cbb3-type subunit 3
MGIFWNIWIIGLTLLNLALLLWVLLANRRVAVSDQDEAENRTTGHVYDGIEEYDNPLPRWWFHLFIGTFVFTGIYLLLYPGLGSFKGLLGWTSVNELRTDQQKGDALYAEQFGIYANTPIEELANDPAAMKMGLRLFANNCAVCHGADGGGNYGYPNLTDNDWIWGGTPDRIKETIVNGRQGVMPPWGSVIGESGVVNVTEYVLKISGNEHDAQLAELGAKVFTQNCAVCHGADGTGNQLLGAPNLTDNIWLYGGEPQDIRQTVRQGRTGVMPAQQELLKADRIHLLAAYVYSLSMDYEE